MSFCLSPDCSQPHNPNNSQFCQTCGTQLLLKQRYRAIKPIGQGGFGKTFLGVDTEKSLFLLNIIIFLNSLRDYLK